MIRTGKFGGMLNAASILNPNKLTALRFASSSVREAAKIGLQTLFSDPSEVLEKYKDFDIVKEMKNRGNSRLLWVRARAIDANKVNSNGDYFDEDEILAEVEYKGEKVPAYKTFEGVPIYSNHKNDDIEQAKGMVVYAEWDEEEKCVYCTFFIDEEAYPDVARAVRHGYIHDVSMGTSVQEGECSECKNIATTEKNWCECLKKYKSKKHPVSGKLVYEKNRGLKFIELSVVGDGAFDLCEIHALFEPEEIIEFSENLMQKASGIRSNITVAASFTPKTLTARYAYEDCLRLTSSAVDSVLKVAQQAGNLVGSDLMEIPQNSQNATVTNILKFLGIDPSTGLNILDLLNLALNFLEVSVMNLFAKKDNIDLAHVSKISKAMAELQTTMQDLIDDGAANTALPQQAQPNIPQGPVQEVPAAVAPGGVGTIVSPGAPGATNTGAQSPMPVQQNAGLGGGVVEQTQSFARVLDGLKNLKIANTQEEYPELSNNNYIGGKLMSFISEFKHNLDQENKVYEVSSPTGERVCISSTGNVTAYDNNNKKCGFSPSLTTEELEMINSGDLKSAGNNALKRFMKVASEFYDDEDKSVIQKVNDMKKNEPTDFVNDRLKRDRLYDDEEEPNKTLDQRTRPLRRNEPGQSYELALDEDSWVSRKGVKEEVREKLLEVSRKGTDDNVIEKRLENWRKTTKPVHQNIERIIGALAKAAIKNGLHPQEVMTTVAQMAPYSSDTIGLTKGLSDQGIGVPGLDSNPEKIVADEMADEVDETNTPGDIQAVFETLAKNIEDAGKALQAAVDAIKGEEPAVPMIEDETMNADEQATADLATQADAMAPNVDSQSVQAGVSAMANTMDQLKVTSASVFNVVKSINVKSAHKMIEEAKCKTATAARTRNNARIAYYGFNRVATNNDIKRTLFGNLADYSRDYNIRSKNLAQVITAMVNTPAASESLIVQAMSEKRNIKTAKTEITDSQVNEKTIRLTVEDLGIELASPDFNETLKSKVVDILTQAGYNVDPNNFNMNEVYVSENGDIEVRVFTKFNRTYSPETSGELKSEVGLEEGEVMPEPISQVPLENNMPGPLVQEDVLESRSAKINALKRRYAQALPPMPSAPGLGTGTPQAPAAAPAAEGAPDLMTSGDDPGLAALSANPDDSMAPTDSQSAPSSSEMSTGVKKPWGTVCPQCQSTNVDISGGNGKCNDCGAALQFEFIVHVTPPAKGEDYKGTFDYKGMTAGEEALGGADALGTGPVEPGLGESTATETPGLGESAAAPMGAQAPAAPAVPAVGATPPAMPMMPMASTDKVRMVRVSYGTDPDVYINANGNNIKSYTPLPVGFTCPACASRRVEKNGRYTFCSDCKTFAVSHVKPHSDDNASLVSTIEWII